MTYTAKTLSDTLLTELEQGYDVIRVSRMAFQLYQDYGLELSPELDEKILQLMAMEEGAEFECSEDEIRALAKELASWQR